MAKKKTTRKELLKRPDEFLTFSGKAVEFYNTHQREFRYLGLVIAVIVIAYLGGRTFLKFVNEKGQEAYNTAYTSLTENMKPNADPGSLRESEELFTEVIDNHGMSKAARLALPQAAYVKFVEKKYDEAIALYEKFLDKVSGDTAYESLASLGLATCYEAKGDLKAAIKALKPVIEAPDDPFKETAMLSLARLYRLDNDPEKSKEILKEFVDKYEASPFHSMAKAHVL